MLKLKIPPEMIDYHKAYFKKYKIKDRLSVEIITDKFIAKKKIVKENLSVEYSDKIRELSNTLRDNLETLAIGTYNELRTLNSEIEKRYEAFDKGDDLIIKEVIKEQFGYENIFVKGHKEVDENCNNQEERMARNWNPYLWAKLLKVRTCAYCNRQYVTYLPKINKSNNGDEQKGGIRPDIDHYWSQHLYPHFSMSLYNWVPSCKICNSSLKRDREIVIDNKTLYEMNFANEFKFRAEGIVDGDIRIKITKEKIDKSAEDLLELFRMEDQYQAHNNIAKDFIRKKIIYNKDMINAIRSNSCEYIAKESIDLLPLIVGFSREENIDKEALGKLKCDLAKQMNLYEI